MHSAHEPGGRTPSIIVQAEPLLVAARDAARLLGLKDRSFERRLASGDLPAAWTRIGRRRLWSVRQLTEWVAAGCPPIDWYSTEATTNDNHKTKTAGPDPAGRPNTHVRRHDRRPPA